MSKGLSLPRTQANHRSDKSVMSNAEKGRKNRHKLYFNFSSRPTEPLASKKAKKLNILFIFSRVQNLKIWQQNYIDNFPMPLTKFRGCISARSHSYSLFPSFSTRRSDSFPPFLCPLFFIIGRKVETNYDISNAKRKLKDWRNL